MELTDILIDLSNSKAALEVANQLEPVKPFRSYYDKDGDAR